MKVKKLDLADRERRAVMERDAEQAASAYYLVLRRVLVEIFQARQSLRRLLYLVEYEQRRIRDYFAACVKLKPRDKPLDVHASLEKICHPLVVVEADVNHIFIFARPELLHQPAFADLARSSDYERLSVFLSFPRFKIFYCGPVHLHHLAYMTSPL